MKRKLTNLIAVAVLFVTPALCLGGMLQHDCDCGVPNGCSHEAECAADPCGDGAAVRENGHGGSGLGVSSALLAVEWPAEATPLAERLPSGTSKPPARPNLPFASSDVPLLI